MPGALPYCVSHGYRPGPFVSGKCCAEVAAVTASCDVQAGFKVDESKATREGEPLLLEGWKWVGGKWFFWEKPSVTPLAS